MFARGYWWTRGPICMRARDTLIGSAWTVIIRRSTSWADVTVRAELELLSTTDGRLIEGAFVSELSRGSQITLTSEPLYLHQGLGRGRPRSLADARRRLELDDDTVTWGTGGGHCCVWIKNDDVFVEDLGSDNGTYVDRAEPLEPPSRIRSRAVLMDDDHLHVGRVQFVLRLRPA